MGLIKKLVIILLFIQIVAGCSNSSGNDSKQKMEIDPLGEDLLEDVQEVYENSDFPAAIFWDIEADFNKVKDKEIKKKLLKLSNNAALKMAETAEPYQLKELFDYSNAQELNKLKYGEYLSEDVKETLMDATYPIAATLEEQNIKMVEFDSYSKIKKGRSNIESTSEFEAKELLMIKGINYGYLINGFSNLIVLKDENIVLEFGGEFGNLLSIFKVIDSEGNVVDPSLPLKDLVEKRVKDNQQQSEELGKELNQQRQEEEEKKKLKIGMSQSEVKERLGQPEDINTTITKYSTREQWIYSGGVYLYFEDGTLDTIQD